MARPGLFSHRKFRHLARTLNDEALAIGTLECLWFAAGETCDPRIGDDRDVEIAARWKGAAGVLAPALLAAGFVDRDESGAVYVVHDYWDHAPEYVLKRRVREAKRRGSVWRNGDHANKTDVSAVCLDRRMPTEQFRAVQSSKDLSRAREQPSVPIPGKGKHQPRTKGAWSCSHDPSCRNYTDCTARALADGKKATP